MQNGSEPYGDGNVDRDVLERQAQRRLDFSLLQREVDRQFLKSPPTTAEEVFGAWCESLARSQSVCACVVVSFRGERARICDRSMWGDQERALVARITKGELPAEIAASICSGQSCMLPTSCLNLKITEREGMICVCPLRNPGWPKALIAVGKEETENEILREFAETTALRISGCLGLIERERGYREMARRSAQICSSSVVAAQFQLERLVTERPAGTDFEKSIRCIKGYLSEVVEGLSRAVLLGYPGPGEAFRDCCVDVADCIRQVGEKLNNDAGSELVSRSDLQRLNSGVQVRASEHRLRLALHDLSLGMWILSQRGPK